MLKLYLDLVFANKSLAVFEADRHLKQHLRNILVIGAHRAGTGAENQLFPGTAQTRIVAALNPLPDAVSNIRQPITNTGCLT